MSAAALMCMLLDDDACLGGDNTIEVTPRRLSNLARITDHLAAIQAVNASICLQSQQSLRSASAAAAQRPGSRQSPAPSPQANGVAEHLQQQVHTYSNHDIDHDIDHDTDHQGG